MATLPPRGPASSGRRGPALPAFCRTRRPNTLVSITSLRQLQHLLLLLLLFQLSTVLLVAGAGRQHLGGPWPSTPSTSTTERGQP